MPSIQTMIKRMHDARDAIEDGEIEGAAKRLRRIFSSAETKLAAIASEFDRFATTGSGNIAQIPENVATAQGIIDDLDKQIQKVIVQPGKAWAKKAVPEAFRAGRDMAGVNLNVDNLSADLVASAFQNVTLAEKAVIEVGFQNTYKIMNVVGNDVSEYFRRELLDAVIDGIPVQGGADSLAGRLIKSGRLKPIAIRSENGRIFHRSIKQRANTIARVEMARVVNKTHEVIAARALGGEAVYINSNPQDSRTTDICMRASQEKPMTLAQWDASQYGRPPRLNPFHMCRSVLIGGMPGWFDQT